MGGEKEAPQPPLPDTASAAGRVAGGAFAGLVRLALRSKTVRETIRRTKDEVDAPQAKAREHPAAAD